MPNNLDISNTIPTGSELRTLLNSSHISHGEINSALKDKGIYVGNSSKSITVPLLSSTLITDTEFRKLLDKSLDRESKPKNKLSSLDLCKNDSDWTTPLKSAFDPDKFDPCVDMEHVDFKSFPRFVVNSPSKATIKYTVHRRDISQDLVKRDLIFHGEVIVEKTGKNLKLYVSSEHTSVETGIINSRIISHLSKELKSCGIVSNSEPAKITFGLFTNSQRILFFKRLTGGLGKNLVLGDVNTISSSR